jgi:hypothetical protein
MRKRGGGLKVALVFASTVAHDPEKSPLALIRGGNRLE